MAQVALPETKDDIDEYLDSYARAQEAMSGEAPDKEEMARVRDLVEEGLGDRKAKSYRVTLKAGDCGQVDDGTFGPGNDCAAGDGTGSADKPKGAPGEDKDKQKEQQETPEFKEWFGDSKVLGEDGEPLIVWHGTKAEVDGDFVFDPEKVGSATDEGFYGTGYYFVGYPHSGGGSGEAGYYGPNVHGFYLKMDNPMDFSGARSPAPDLPSNLLPTEKYDRLDVEKFIAIEDGLRKSDLLTDKVDKTIEAYKTEMPMVMEHVEVSTISDRGKEGGYYPTIDRSKLPKNSALYKPEDGTWSTIDMKPQSYVHHDDGTSTQFYFETPEKARRGIQKEAWRTLKQEAAGQTHISEGPYSSQSVSDYLRTQYPSKLISERLASAGYDGVIFGDEYVAFDANQIKSSEFNTGEFGKGDNRVGKSFNSYRISLDEKEKKKIRLTAEDENEQS